MAKRAVVKGWAFGVREGRERTPTPYEEAVKVDSAPPVRRWADMSDEEKGKLIRLYGAAKKREER